MGQQLDVRLDIERYRGLLSTDACEDQQEVIENLLAECRAQLAELTRKDSLARPTAHYADQARRREGLDRRIQELEEGLLHLQRLTELGQVVTALVHEISEPLTAITNYVAACRRLMCGRDELVEGVLKQIAAQTDRACQLVGHVRVFTDEPPQT